MNNLHRELAPISDAAWAQIEEEASRTLKRYLAARRIVDVSAPQGYALAATGTGHTKRLESPDEGLRVLQRLVDPVVEFRVPFTLLRQEIDDVERGSNDSDWLPLKEAARKIAYAEDRAIFDGYRAAGLKGIREGASNAKFSLPPSVRGYPTVIAQALNELRLAGVNGPYRLVLGTEAFTKVSGGDDEGYPVLKHIQRLIEGDVIWAPAIQGGVIVTTRGGDFQLTLGQDLSIGYLSHTEKEVELYLQESFSFRLLTTEAVVELTTKLGSENPE